VFGLTAMVLVIGGTETNPSPQMDENTERFIDHMMAQREEGKSIRELVQKNKPSTDVLQNTTKESGTKIDQLTETAKTTKEEQERMKNLVNSWDVKQKGIERN
jgi:hypothetical protein